MGETQGNWNNSLKVAQATTLHTISCKIQKKILGGKEPVMGGFQANHSKEGCGGYADLSLYFSLVRVSRDFVVLL